MQNSLAALNDEKTRKSVLCDYSIFHTNLIFTQVWRKTRQLLSQTSLSHVPHHKTKSKKLFSFRFQVGQVPRVFSGDVVCYKLYRNYDIHYTLIRRLTQIRIAVSNFKTMYPLNNIFQEIQQQTLVSKLHSSNRQNPNR